MVEAFLVNETFLVPKAHLRRPLSGKNITNERLKMLIETLLVHLVRYPTDMIKYHNYIMSRIIYLPSQSKRCFISLSNVLIFCTHIFKSPV